LRGLLGFFVGLAEEIRLIGARHVFILSRQRVRRGRPNRAMRPRSFALPPNITETATGFGPGLRFFPQSIPFRL
jgi:hypothetical protein